MPKKKVSAKKVAVKRRRIEVGKTYQTVQAGTVFIESRRQEGRKPFSGILQRTGERIAYFRNGIFSNASRTHGGHPFDIRREIKTTT